MNIKNPIHKLMNQAFHIGLSRSCPKKKNKKR